MYKANVTVNISYMGHWYSWPGKSRIMKCMRHQSMMNSKYHSCQYKLNMQKRFVYSQIIFLSQLIVWLHNCFIQQNGDRVGKDYGRVRFQFQAAASHESLLPLLRLCMCPTHFQCIAVVCSLTLLISYLFGPNCDLLRDTSRKWGQRAKERP